MAADLPALTSVNLRVAGSGFSHTFVAAMPKIYGNTGKTCASCGQQVFNAPMPKNDGQGKLLQL